MSEQSTKPKILIVDDSRVMRVAVRKILAAEYEVAEAEDGEHGWSVLQEDPSIQVVFTDLSMPNLDGYGLLRRIRESDDERLSKMPVVIVTGKEDNDDAKQAALDKGANDFISKPFESVQLIARAKSNVRLEQTEKALGETTEKLEQEATVDPQTSLGTRRYFEKSATELLAQLRRHGGQCVMLRLDIDDFNNVFIRHGKEAANAVLKEIGKLVRANSREEDKAARIGMAKFALLLPATDLAGGRVLADRLRREIRAAGHSHGDNVFHITASIGLYEPAVDESLVLDSLLSTTEQHLAAAVKAGGNQVAGGGAEAKPAATPA
ncbi:MAG: response regulator, partial [Pseudomonadota bacterium]